MENYKRKPLKFVGMGRDVRLAELTTARSTSRQQKFSLQRPTNTVEGSEENIPSSSGIPILGNKKSKEQKSRAEMLKKWKEERLLKKKIELQSKKPVFKTVAGTQPKYDSNLYKSDDSRIQQSHSSKNPSLIKKTSTKSNASDGKFTIKSQATNIKPQSNIPSIKPKLPVTTLPIQKESKSKASNSSSKLKPLKVETPNIKGSKKASDGKFTIKSQAANIKPQTLPGQLSSCQSSHSAAVKQMETIYRKPVGKSNQSKSRKELPKEETKIVPESENKGSLFRCQLSSIKPVNTSKSFAPDEFVFTPLSKFKHLSHWNKPNNDSLQISREQITSTPKSSELNNNGKLGSGCIQETQSTKNGSVKSNEESLGNVPSSETKYILSLLDDNSNKLVMPSFLQSMQSEQDQNLEMPRKENIEEMPSGVVDSQTNPSEQLSFKTVSTKHYPQGSALNTNPVKLEQSKTIDFKIPEEPKGIEESSSSGLPTQKETTRDSSVLLKMPLTAIPDFHLLEQGQEKVMAIKPCLLEEGCPATEVFSSGKAETDSVFLPPSIHDRTESKSTLNKNPTQEIGETPKTAGKCKAQRKIITGEFTPRRSLRLARLNQAQSEENLFEIEEPSCIGFEESCRLTEDFGRLNLEPKDAIKNPQRQRSTKPSTSRAADVSLLYTPPRTRASTRIKSLGEDLMSFSPNV